MKRNRAAFYAHAWKEAAAQTDSTIESLGAEIFEITKGEHTVRVYEQHTQLGDSVTNRLLEHKEIVYRLLSKIDVPIPRYIVLKDLDISAATTFMTDLNQPVVVKPAYGTGSGAGITTNIMRASQLYRAIAWSRTFCPTIIIEEQIQGNNYRLLFLDGVLLDCIERKPPTVTGDGMSSIQRLIDQENRQRVKGDLQLAQNLIPIDLDTKNSLAAQGLTLRTIPVRGQIVKVKDIINCNRAEENESPSEKPAESLLSLGQEISATAGARLVGIDIITSDLTIDLDQSGGRVIEINTPPGHFYHHFKKGEGYPVAVQLLQKAFEV
ncbi:MAG: hypothetical protein AAF485_06995 [Chloroflexota bacterium]